MPITDGIRIAVLGAADLALLALPRPDGCALGARDSSPRTATDTPPATAAFYVLPFLSAAAITAANLIQRRAGLTRADALVWLVLAVSLGAYALMWRLLERTSATRFASLFFLGPPVTMLMARVAFGDAFLLTDLAGLAVAGCGILLVTLRSP